MNLVKNFLGKKGVGYFLTLPALGCGIAALCLYIQNGVTAFNPELNRNAIVCLWISIALCAVSLVLEWKPAKYVSYLVYLYAFLWFVYSQVTYIANVFVGIDGNTFTPAFLSTAVCFLLAALFMLLAGALTKWRPWKKKTPCDTAEVEHEQ